MTFAIIVLATALAVRAIERSAWDERWVETSGTATSDAARSRGVTVIDVAFVGLDGTDRGGTLPVFSFQGGDDPSDLLDARAGDVVPLLLSRDDGEGYVAHHYDFDLPPWLWAALAFGLLNTGVVSLAWFASDHLTARADRRAGIVPPVLDHTT